MLKLTFLGTSSGVPTKHRNVSALAVECFNPYGQSGQRHSKKQRPWLLIDCGEATQHQLLHSKLSLHHLSAICITHVHGDHCYGLPGLLASAAMAGRKQPLTLIAPADIEHYLNAVTQYTQMRLSFAIEFVAIEDLLAAHDPNYRLQLTRQHHLNIVITPLSHRVASHAFVLTQQVTQQRLNTQALLAAGIAASPVWGRLQQGEDVLLKDGRLLKAEDYMLSQQQQLKVVLAGDNDCPQLLSEAVSDAAVLVHEATYTQAVLDGVRRRADGFDPQHSSAKQVAEFAQTTAIPALILTHFSARYQPFHNADSRIANMADMAAEVAANYDGAYWLATDFAQFVVDGDGVRYLGDKGKITC